MASSLTDQNYTVLCTDSKSVHKTLDLPGLAEWQAGFGKGRPRARAEKILLCWTTKPESPRYGVSLHPGYVVKKSTFAILKHNEA